MHHHIVDYAIDPNFRPTDMMVLCPNGHDMATKGALGITEQRKFKANPFNRKRGFAAGKLTIGSPQCAVKLGTTVFILEGSNPLLVVDDIPLLTISLSDNNTVQISALLYSAADDLLASIDQNGWISGDVGIWDIESDHQRLKIRSRKGQIRLDLNTKSDPISLSADL